MASILASSRQIGELSGLRLEKTAKLMKLTLSRILAVHPDLNMTVDQWVVLHLIYKNDSLSQQEIGELAFKDAPTITRMIDLMEAKNLVIRTQDKDDKRRFSIQLTEVGKKNYTIALPIIRSFREKAYEGISVDELDYAEKIMKQIFNNLSKIS